MTLDALTIAALSVVWISLVTLAMGFSYWCEDKLTIGDAAFCILVGPIMVLAVILTGVLKLLFSKEFWNTPIFTKK